MDKYNLSIPMLPGFDMTEWLTSQANTIQNLAQNCRRSIKNRSNKQRGSSSSMDQLQTLPYFAEDMGFKLPTNFH